MKKNRRLYWGMIVLLTLQGCGEHFLEVKSDAGIGSPYKLEDYQAIMDNANGIMNTKASVVLGFAGNDEVLLSSSKWEAFSNTVQRNAYIWADEVYERNTVDDWNEGYLRILNTNMVLEGLQKLARTPENAVSYDNVKGSALFFRALSHYQLAQLFAVPYSRGNSLDKLGIPLRLESDMNVRTVRASLQETYDCVLRDLQESLPLLPETSPIKVRPSKVACYGLLARVYMAMQDYEKAWDYAGRSLDIESELVDYGTLSASATYPFTADYGASNPEVLFFQEHFSVTILARTRMDVAPGLLELYQAIDLRKTVFFNKTATTDTFYRGSYSGKAAYFVGVSVPEILLIRAECEARMERFAEAIAILNRIREKRFSANLYVAYDEEDIDRDVLGLVLEERRRELAFRGLRWEDLRRLNQEPDLATTIKREVGGEEYILEPNSTKYVWPVPERVVELSGIAQNDR